LKNVGFKNLFKKIKNQEKEINHVKMFFYLKKIKIVLFLIFDIIFFYFFLLKSNIN